MSYPESILMYILNDQKITTDEILIYPSTWYENEYIRVNVIKIIKPVLFLPFSIQQTNIVLHR